MPEHPGVSVVIPTYQREQWVGKAIASVLSQIRPDDEVIVVDDGSTDSTESVVRGFGDSVRYRHVPHAGAGPARNEGIRIASRPIVAFLDSDDEWLPGKLEAQRRIMHQWPEVVMCFANYLRVTRAGRQIHQQMAAKEWEADTLGPAQSIHMTPNPTDHNKDPSAESAVYHVGDAYLGLLRAGPVIQINTVVARRDALLKYPFPEDLPIYEEDLVFAQLAGSGPVAFLDREVSILRMHGGAQLSDILGSVEELSAWVTVMERAWGSGPPLTEAGQETYESMHSAYLLERARSFLVRGRLGDARADLGRLKSPPIYLILASRLPSTAIRTLVSVRRGIRKILDMLQRRNTTGEATEQIPPGDRRG